MNETKEKVHSQISAARNTLDIIGPVALSEGVDQLCQQTLKEDLIAAGIASADQFPTGKRDRPAKFRAYEAGKAKNAAGYLGLDVYSELDQVF